MMTVKEAREILANLPDDAILAMEHDEQCCFFDVDGIEDLTGNQDIFALCWGETIVW